jgi:hypothetical protein
MPPATAGGVVMSKFPSCPVLALSVLVGCAASAAAQTTVYAGCEAPAARPTGHTFFVDPVNGSSRGDGSRAHPWRTLAEIVRNGAFSTSPFRGGSTAPIKPGDTVFLLSGDHGAVKLQGASGDRQVGYFNPDFITIAALPGQTPVLRKLDILGGAKWVFRGLTFQSLNENPVGITMGNHVKDYFLVTLFGPHSNILLDNNHFLSAPDVSRWKIPDWVDKRVSGIQDVKGDCISITNNHIGNIGFGIATQSSSKVIIANNTIDHFTDDGIDYGSSGMLIENNRITNSIEDGDGFHRDAMQGQPYDGSTTVRDVTIRDNTVIRITDPNLMFPGYLQGIDTFDGIWYNVQVTGNVVITSATHGISYYGTHNLLIRSNVLLLDDGKVLPCSRLSMEQCLATSVVYDPTPVPRIVVTHKKTSEPSSDVVIEKNIATGITVDPSTVRSTVRKNLCVLTNGKCTLGIPGGAKTLWASKPGAYGENNVISDHDARGLFVTFDPKAAKYDVKLKHKLDSALR